jgi:hypothetical protein
VSPAERSYRDPDRSLAALRRATAERLRERREEIYEAVIHRAFSVAPPSGKEVPGYVEALRGAIPSAVEHAFHAIEVGEDRTGPTPAAIFVQAAASARSNVGLEVVMRRYAAGYSTISDFLHQAVRASGEGSIQGYPVLQRDLTALFDRFVVEVTETYRHAEGKTLPSPEERRLERVARLLAGDLVDPAGLDYPLEGYHLALIISGDGHQEAAPDMARRLDRHLLTGERSIGRTTIWLGGRRLLTEEDLEEVLETLVAEGLHLTMGEPGEGLAGWRRSRRQAEAAQLVAERTEDPIVRYRDVAFLSAALRDPDLAHFLAEAYVEPLGDDRYQLGQTILTLIEMNGNASSTGAALGITRQTVASRMRAVEDKLGRALGSCAGDLQTALRLAGLGA